MTIRPVGSASSSFASTVGQRLPRGCVQTFRVGGAAPSTVGAAFSFVQTWTTEEYYNAVRFEYSNYGAGTVDITAAKTAPTATHADNGTGLTYANITFTNSAAAKAGDRWDGTAGSATSYTIPAKVSGTGANTVPTRIWSDWVAQTPIVSTEADYEGMYISNHRTYSATASFSIMQFGTSATNFGDYNTNSRRKSYGAVVAGNTVSSVTSFVPLAATQWMFATGFQALLIKPIYNHGIFGDSISKGQGSYDPNHGLWGYAQRAPQQLTDDGLSRHSVVNYAVSGQGKAASLAFFLSVIAENNLDTALIFPWSPNDDGGSTPWNLNNFLFHISVAYAECQKYGTALIVATQPPCADITDAVGDAIRKANNQTIRNLALEGVTIADFDAAVTNAAAPARFKLGLSSDNIHPSSSGYAVMAQVYKDAIKSAIGL